MYKGAQGDAASEWRCAKLTDPPMMWAARVSRPRPPGQRDRGPPGAWPAHPRIIVNSELAHKCPEPQWESQGPGSARNKAINCPADHLGYLGLSMESFVSRWIIKDRILCIIQEFFSTIDNCAESLTRKRVGSSCLILIYILPMILTKKNRLLSKSD